MYSPGSPKEIQVELHRAHDEAPEIVELSRLPRVAGKGYLAGEQPDGITTLNKKGVSAKVRVLLRQEGPNDGCLVAETTSGNSGEWRVDGLSPHLKFDVIGRLDGHDDSGAFDVAPVPTDWMYLHGAFEPNDTLDGMEGAVTILGGEPPYTLQINVPPPNGITMAIDRRNILLIGTSAEQGLHTVQAEVFSGNGLSLPITITIPIGVFAPPVLSEAGIAKLFKPTRLTPFVGWAGNEPRGHKDVGEALMPPASPAASPVWDSTLYPPAKFDFDIAKLFKPTRFDLHINWKEGQ